MPKIRTFDNGVLVSEVDDRTLAEAKAEKRLDLAAARDADLWSIDVGDGKFSPTHLALFVAEEHTALGPFLLPSERADIGAGLAAIGAKIDAARTALAAAATNDDVDAIQW